HYHGLTHGLIPFALEVADRAAAAFSIEPRYPFFDKRLAEFCLALPPDQKLHKGWIRMVMRRGMANILPKEIQWRGGKSNLSPNFIRRLAAFRQDLLDEVILNDPKVIQEYIDIEAVREIYRRYLTRGTHDDALAIWKTATLALWLRRTGLK
ncbi:MAG: asparagine synthetase B, partial [Nitrospirae bacterium]|nr:asparagine synthetase B [Nitrospirota bacterium]